MRVPGSEGSAQTKEMIGWKQILAVLGALAFGILPAAGPVCAAENTGEERSITVCFSTENHTNGIGGAVFSILRVAEESAGGYSLISPLETFGKDFGERFGAEDPDLPGEMFQCLREKKEGGSEEKNVRALSRVTDSEGKAVFEGLEEGVYLIWESEAEGKAAAYQKADPILASVPAGGDENVTVCPKTGPVREANETAEDKPSPGTGKAGIVRTGDSSRIVFFGILAPASVSLALWLMFHRKKKR